jgi:hypothetical protein
MVGYDCKNFLILWLTGFGDDPRRHDGELLLREVLKTRPQAEQAQCNVERSPASKTLTARSEPYNRKAAHAKLMTDTAESCDHR